MSAPRTGTGPHTGNSAGPRKVTLVGGGLVGALEAIYLARRGFEVEVLERRPDMRRETVGAGRSINLAISMRGLYALERVGLADEVLRLVVPMRGRMLHSAEGTVAFQRYGRDDSQCINSLSRRALNTMLMSAAEATGSVRFRFGERVASVNLEGRCLRVEEAASGTVREEGYDLLIGTDGSASVVRDAIAARAGARCTEEELDYGYKELTIPPRPDGGFALEPGALHIWPRRTFMLIALPNPEGSFTCTLFLPWAGAVSFAALDDPASVERFFETHFPDAARLIADLAGTFFANPTGRMVTVRLSPWHAGGDVQLMGDAAHAIVPFFGQGMNCGFEDCTVLDEMITEAASAGTIDWEALLDRFTASRAPNSNAIADMAVENFLEMRDRVADPRFLLRKAVERVLEVTFPGRYVPRYSLVSFSTVPYRFAQQVGEVQAGILDELCPGLERAEDVDIARAERLIEARLAPMFRDQDGLLPATGASGERPGGAREHGPAA